MRFVTADSGTPYAFTNYPLVCNALRQLAKRGIKCRSLRIDKTCWYIESKTDPTTYLAEESIVSDNGQNVELRD